MTKECLKGFTERVIPMGDCVPCRHLGGSNVVVVFGEARSIQQQPPLQEPRNPIHLRENE